MLVGILSSAALCTVLFFTGGLARVQGGADLVVCFGPEPQTLDPGIMSGITEARYGYALFEGLITYAEDGATPIPGAAESWTISDDQRVYTFKLRDTTWSNGEPIVADDFVWSFLRANDPASGSDYSAMTWYIKGFQAWHFAKGALAAILGGELKPEERSKAVEELVKGATKDMIPELQAAGTKRPEEREAFEQAMRAAETREVGLRVIDDRTLEVTLEAPTPFILDVFGFHTYMPVNRKCLERHADDWLKPEHFVGNGAFVVDGWWPQYRVVLKRNPRYWDVKNVGCDRIVIMNMDNANTAMNYYDTGKIDFLDRVVIPPDFLELLSKRDDYHTFPAFGDYFFRYNVTKPPFNDPRVRKAFTHALDRRVIANEILRGGEVPYDRLTPPFPGFEPDTKGCPYDEAKAKQWMDEAFPDRSKFPAVEFLTRNSKKGLDIYSYCKEQWRKVLGITVGVKSQEWSVYLTSMSKLDYDVSYGGWIADYYDPHTFIDIWITGGGNNRTGWSNKQYDQWVDDALKEPDTAKRFAIYGKCEKMIVEDECIIAPIYLTAERVMMKPHVKGVKHNMMDRYLLKYWKRER